jgi:hypothetical protein
MERSTPYNPDVVALKGFQALKFSTAEASSVRRGGMERDTTGQVGANPSYFFFRFGRGSLNGPLIPSATASRAKRSITASLFLRGNANGWPIFQSVI